MKKRIWIPVLLGIMAISAAGCGKKNDVPPAAPAEEQSETVQETSEEAEEQEVFVLPELAEGEELLIPQQMAVATSENPIPDAAIEWTENMAGVLEIPALSIKTNVYYGGENGGPVLGELSGTDFIDGNTIIEGKLADGLSEVAASLNPALIEEPSYIYFYTREGVGEFRIFAAFEGEDRDLTEVDFLDYEAFAAYIDEILHRKSIGANLDVSAQEEVTGTWQIITVKADEENGTSYYLLGTLTGVIYH